MDIQNIWISQYLFYPCHKSKSSNEDNDDYDDNDGDDDDSDHCDGDEDKDDDFVTWVRIPGHLPAWQRHSLQRKKNKNQYLSIIFLDDIYIKNQSLNSKKNENQYFPKI